MNDDCLVENCFEKVYVEFTWKEDVKLVLDDEDIECKKGDRFRLCKTHAMLVFPFLVKTEDLSKQ